MKDKLSKRFIQLEESNYAINEYGQVKNTVTKNILKPFLISDYPAVNIYVNKKRKTVYIHHLMAATFLNYKAKRGLTSINHIDHDKTNNRLDNLEVISHRRNSALGWMNRNRTLPTGVTENPRGRKKYKAQINYKGTPRYLGCYETPEEAHAKYMEASDYITAHNDLPPSVKERKKYGRVEN